MDATVNTRTSRVSKMLLSSGAGRLKHLTLWGVIVRTASLIATRGCASVAAVQLLRLVGQWIVVVGYSLLASLVFGDQMHNNEYDAYGNLIETPTRQHLYWCLAVLIQWLAYSLLQCLADGTCLRLVAHAYTAQQQQKMNVNADGVSNSQKQTLAASFREARLRFRELALVRLLVASLETGLPALWMSQYLQARKGTNTRAASIALAVCLSSLYFAYLVIVRTLTYHANPSVMIPRNVDGVESLRRSVAVVIGHAKTHGVRTLALLGLWMGFRLLVHLVLVMSNGLPYPTSLHPGLSTTMTNAAANNIRWGILTTDFTTTWGAHHATGGTAQVIGSTILSFVCATLFDTIDVILQTVVYLDIRNRIMTEPNGTGSGLTMDQLCMELGVANEETFNAYAHMQPALMPRRSGRSMDGEDSFSVTNSRALPPAPLTATSGRPMTTAPPPAVVQIPSPTNAA